MSVEESLGSDRHHTHNAMPPDLIRITSYYTFNPRFCGSASGTVLCKRKHEGGVSCGLVSYKSVADRTKVPSKIESVVEEN
eukprot:6252758-Amphidinium_carterae.1